MDIYHKIKTVFDRDHLTNYKTVICGKFSKPEFKYLKDNKWLFTEKVDGTNIRVIIRKRDTWTIEIRGRSDKANVPDGVTQYIHSKLSDFVKLGRCFEHAKLSEGFVACLYGEGFGPKIQKGGGKYRKDQGFVLFDVMINNVWLDRKDVVDISDKLEIEVVPVLSTGPLSFMVEMCQEGFNSRWGDFMAEGIVARPEVEMYNKQGKRIITKLKCKDFDRGK